VSTLLFSLGRWSYRHPWRVLTTWLLLLVVAGVSAVTFMAGTDNSFSIPGTEAQEGIVQLDRTFPQASGTSAQVLVAAPDAEAVTDDAYRTAIDDALSAFGDLDGVLAVTDPFDENVSGLVSDDDEAAIIRLQLDGQATDIPAGTEEDLQEIADDLQTALPEAQVVLGGDLFSTEIPSLSPIEAVGVLIALFVLIVTFRSFAVAWFPLVSALIGVGLAIALIFVATAFATISSTTPMLAIMLGLAVGIDYALFIVARHQDQVRAGVEPEESAARATGTAGSAVVFAGVTVLIALVGLSFANIPFLTTMGIAAAVAVAIAVLVAVTLTPALLGFAKGRVVGWRRRPSRRARRARTRPRRVAQWGELLGECAALAANEALFRQNARAFRLQPFNEERHRIGRRVGKVRAVHALCALRHRGLGQREQRGGSCGKLERHLHAKSSLISVAAACAAIPSPRPVKPSRSVVVAFTLTAST